MLHALSWFIVALLMAAWSLTVWALHALSTWVLAQLGRMNGADDPDGTGTGTGTEALPALPDWMEAWIPAEWVEMLQSGLALLAPALQQLLEALPMLGGGLTLVAWLIWGVGAFLLLLAGAVLHGLIALWRRSASTAPTTSGPSAPPGSSGPALPAP